MPDPAGSSKLRATAGSSEEHQIGTIEPGKLADMVVLSDDYFAVPDEQLKKIRSVLTIVGGRIVHETGV